LNRKIEFILASLLTVFIFLGVVYGLPPFSSVMDIGENLKESWEKTYEAPPVPHAEEFTIAELSVNMLKVPEATIISKLTNLGIEVENSEQNLKELALQVALSPQEIYNTLAGKSHSAGGKIQPGGGLGRKSLQLIADENNLLLDDLLIRLEDAGIQASGEDLIRDLADRNNLIPSEIITVLNGDTEPENH
jgi:hypothetical protein